MRTTIGRLFMVSALAALFAGQTMVLAGCATSRTGRSETTGQYIDDSTITGKVKAAILEDPDLKFNEIGVETYQGVVQLSGFVDSSEIKTKAAEVAKNVPGVVSVKNDLIVKAG